MLPATDPLWGVPTKLSRCLLCESPRADYIAYFLPDWPELWIGPPLRLGKMRVIRYKLCAKCFKCPDRVVAAEEKILRVDLAAGSH